jgi:hypothetical protein
MSNVLWYQTYNCLPRGILVLATVSQISASDIRKNEIISFALLETCVVEVHLHSLLSSALDGDE